MKKYHLLIVFTLIVSLPALAQIKAGRNQSFDENWSFRKGKMSAPKNENFDDTDWRKLDLPHDWSIEDLSETPTDSTIGPFYKNAVGKNSTAFTVGGTAWYRKKFVMDKSTEGKQVSILFEGVYMIADVWINGHHLGSHPNGYTSFWYDLSPYLKPVGEQNVIAVEVKNEGDNSRWYAGSGIYRHVWLNVVNPTHIAKWGVQIVSENISASSADIQVATAIDNNKDNLTITTEIYSADNKLVGSKSTETLGKEKIEHEITLKEPNLWDTEHPYLYKAKITLKQDQKIIDTYWQNFGIRSMAFDATSGFTINGQNLKLKGACIHHDNGALGAAAIDRAEERKIELLKANGYNAVRFAHNPNSPKLLEACDKLGMLVINEAFDMWNTPKTPDDYANYFKDWWQIDLTTVIQRDFNHPSVIMWSIGNEITEIIDSLGYEYSQKLTDFAKSLDTSRPITGAMPFHIPLMRGKKWDTTAPAFAPWDVAGYNYSMSFYNSDHRKHPERIMVTTEYFPPKALENWNMVEKNPHIIGMFSWAGIDYLGEAGIGLARIRKNNEKAPDDFQKDFMGPEWPIFNSYTGELDLIGNKKAASYYLDVVWRRSPLEMLVHRPLANNEKEYTGFYAFPDELKSWTWPGHEGDSLEVSVYTRGEKVKLELNGKMLEEKKLEKGSIKASFKVPFTSGKLVARSFDGAKEVATQTLSTTAKPYAIRLKADRNIIKADKKDLSYIAVEIVDEAGNLVPNVDDLLVKYQILGEGKLAGAANGNPRDMSSFQKPEKQVFQGKGLLIVRSTVKAGNIKIVAKAEGLKDGILNVKTQ